MEDVWAGRITAVDSEELKAKLTDELKTLIPTSYSATISPLSLNFVDQERIVSLM